MVGADGVLPLPWLAPWLRRAAVGRSGHALLLQGPEGVGQFELALALAQTRLCENAEVVDLTAAPCGRCAGCRLVQARSHPDLRVVVPEALAAQLGWDEAEGEGGGERSTKAKPSREIKVDAVRGIVGFAQTTPARGRGKVVVVHPAERMNPIAANTLLKTLEEPPGDARFILSTAAPDALLPTVRSRCQRLAIPLPPKAQAVAWLEGQGVADAEALLAGAGGQPQTALAWARDGLDAAAWRRLPAAVAAGDAAVLASWPLPRAIEALQKLCHDLAAASVGAPPRFFPVASVAAAGPASLDDLQRWQRELTRAARHAEHPWNAGLMVDSLVRQGRQAIRGAAHVTAGPRSRSRSG